MKPSKSIVLKSIKSLQDQRVEQMFELKRVRQLKKALLQDEQKCIDSLYSLTKKMIWELKKHAKILREP